MKHYDCIIIGTGPAGQKGAIQAAKLGKRVAVIEKNSVLGGAQINTGTIPSKALREAALHLTGVNRRGLFGNTTCVKSDITVADLASVSQQVIRQEWDVIRSQFDRNHVELLWGRAEFQSPNEVIVHGPDSSEVITADQFLIAVGTRPARPENIPFNEGSIFTSDEILKLDRLPRTMIVVGGGVIGTEYACIMSTLGVRVTLVEGRDRLLGFLDREICDAFQYFLRQKSVTLRLGEKVEEIKEVEVQNGTPHTLVQAQLESGKTLRAETLLYAVGRQGVCGALGLDKVGIEFDDRERLHVNDDYQTNVEHVYAAGDVIGFPALASTSMEQGRRAICHAFGQCDVGNYNTSLFPYGIYAVPEISMVGKTEEQLTEEGIPFEAGIAHYREIARGQLIGDELGMLKLLIHQDTHEILGVHTIGTGATELIHIGQAVMALGGKAQFFINNVFNFPTLAECYKVAAYNGLNKLNHV
ncbi:Si-specific NAD(P)(+) transhydrogenase [Adhaeretor mobilis]|uniref:Soluble pyridine nucleotide transhydrogenase n=1 Tax=Adhaeretor mobilis TaxID=1930276 RepID=A0A517MWW2_9BACT|nr:Si-specific NAD(P)(+) transhydrogenase [Adhaeretor mobilis]QDS99366.1 Soluble pyridine nucleotide transhydrogenase [Adhaeretor mobilis]